MVGGDGTDEVGTTGGLGDIGGVGVTSPSSKGSVSASDALSRESAVESTDVKTIVGSGKIFSMSESEVRSMMGWVSEEMIL